MTDAIFARSAATDTLVEMLSYCPEGGAVTYEAMARATNRDIQRKDRHLLMSALRIVRAESGAVFSSIQRVGLQRLKPEEVMFSGKRRVKRIVNAAKRGAVEMDTVRPERLDQDQRTAHAAIRGVFASIQTAAKTPRPPAPTVTLGDPEVKLGG